MTITVQRPTAFPGGIASAAEATGPDLLQQLGVIADVGLSSPEAARRLAQAAANVVSSHRARLLPVLWHSKRIFYRTAAAPAIPRRFGRRHHLRRRAARFSTAASADPTPPGCAPANPAAGRR